MPMRMHCIVHIRSIHTWPRVIYAAASAAPACMHVVADASSCHAVCNYASICHEATIGIGNSIHL